MHALAEVAGVREVEVAQLGKELSQNIEEMEIRFYYLISLHLLFLACKVCLKIDSVVLKRLHWNYHQLELIKSKNSRSLFLKKRSSFLLLLRHAT